MNKFILCLILCFSASTLCACRVYVDKKECVSQGDRYYIHIGNNFWLMTDVMKRDVTGLYTLEKSFMRSQTGGERGGYVKRWRCPYCYMYWPVGDRCGNNDCPSRY